MDFIPDVLDHIGRTPREFGALHAHFESVQVDGERAVANVLFQGAFHPMPKGGEVVFFASNEERFEIRELARFPVPTLEKGAVLRVRYPLSTLAVPSLSHVQVKVDAPAPSEKAERIRPPWKLFDTFEIPKLSEMNPSGGSSMDAGQMAFGAAAVFAFGGLGAVVARQAFGGAMPNSAETPRTKTHKARELPPGLLLPVQQGAIAELVTPQTEELWAIGKELPSPMALVAFKAPQANAPTGRRFCAACGFSGKMADYERDRTCPTCGDYWT